MKSPLTGSEMELESYNKEIFGITFYYQYYRCYDTGEGFTDTQLDEKNLESFLKELSNQQLKNS